MLVTSEHGGNSVPSAIAPLFRGRRGELHSHRGYDPGALDMARGLADGLGAPLVASTVSRLVIDLNRSLDNAGAWSAPTRALPPEKRDRIIRQYYVPYRSKVERLVAVACDRRRRVYHFSSHSFTPVLDGKRRHADVGLLYDPARPYEAKLCAAIKKALLERLPSLCVRRNYPYAGTSDGLTTWLRKRYAADEYCGIEIELNQAIVARAPSQWRWLREALVPAITSALPVNGRTARR
jgi:predicted N-formylglutamate amidohydrolase